MARTTEKITFCLNWGANPYHAPIYLAQKLGYFKEEGIDVAIMEPANPSDVTELIGTGKIDFGLKAMIHTIAAKARGLDLTSFGTLLDEPFTGLIHVKSKSGIKADDFQTLKGKKIGYVGEFGKIIIDELCGHYGMRKDEYEAVRVGMNVTDAIKRGVIDAGVGLENVQQVELEHWAETEGKGKDDIEMIRIDELAKLGCCCFCSVLYVYGPNMREQPEKLRSFMRAIRKSTDFVMSSPEKAWAQFTEIKPVLANATQKEVFDRSLVYMSKYQLNVVRDWNKVTKYSQRLGETDESFVQNFTNEFIENVPEKILADNEAGL